MREPAGRLEKKVDRENLWLYICCLLAERDMYGFEIRRLIQGKFGFLAGSVTAYKVLYLLEHGGYVGSYLKSGRRYYRITDRGKGQLRKAREFFRKRMKTLGWQ